MAAKKKTARPDPAERSPELAAIDVYDGTTRLGSICERSNGQYEAAPAEGPSLGMFAGRAAAMHAVIARAKAA